MTKPDYSISTPENVDLHLELAGLGNRALACLIDKAIGLAIGIALALLVWGVNTLLGFAPISFQARSILDGVLILFLLLGIFVLLFGYHIIFEGIWHGQTPGKKITQIRVIEANGQPVSWSAVFIRGLIGVFDLVVVIVGLLVMLIDKHERRLGDLAAGTLVIRERLPDLSAINLIGLSAKSNVTSIDVGGLTPQEYELLVTYLKRRGSMLNSHRPLVAKQLEAYFRAKLHETSTDGGDPEQFLEQVYVAYQSRAD